VFEAEHGVTALEVLHERHIDLAIVDVHMPVMNGIELIRSIRNDPALEQLPIIVQTSDQPVLKAPVWRDLHVSQLVDKMVFMDWLATRVEEHMRHAS